MTKMKSSELALMHPQLISAEFLTFQTILVESKQSFTKEDVQLVSNQAIIDYAVISQQQDGGVARLILEVEGAIELGSVYELVSATQGRIRIFPGRVVQTSLFDRKYSYEGPLGVMMDDGVLSLFVWSPIAERIECVIYDTTETVLKTSEMKRGDRGVYQITLARE